jgi:UDP-N-acetylmuramyl-tripeptide synthetase
MAGLELSPPLLARWLGRMAAGGVSHAVVEASSRGLSQSLLAGIELDAVCVTHVGRAHLDWHGSLENYRQAKRRILDHLRPEGVAILNADCQASMRILAEHNGPALTFGLTAPAEISAEIVEQHVNEQTFVLTAGDESAAVRTAIIGDHHMANCLAAATTALAYGVDLTAIARGLEALDELPGRMQRIPCGHGFAVFVDAADRPDSLRACLKAARAVTTGRLICVFGADHVTSRDERATLGRVAGALSDFAVITTSTARHRGVDDFSCDVVYGFTNPRKAHVILNRAEAIRFALDEAREGDTVVLAGMGQREYPSAAAGGGQCDDAELVRQLLTGANQFTAGYRVAA